MHTYISSRTNPTVQLIASLEKKKHREESGLYLCEGIKLCREALGRCKVRYAAVREDKARGDVLEMCEKSGGEIIVLSESAFAKISADTSPDGVVFVIEMENNYGSSFEGERVIMLDSVRDPGNVGTVIRCAAAFGFDRVILSDCADIYNPKTVRATMGALFKMKFTEVSSSEEVIEALRSEGRRVIAAALGESALTLGASPLRADDCIVIGNEGHGVSEATLNGCTGVIKIPMTDKTESLNAAVAASVIMWEQFKV
ncbi:MAG: RNA methyltransferase [Clostridia bacterium]|nr:RNA methyltransferase [Clostridia bacterium]